MARTDSTKVQAILGPQYTAGASLTAFIDTATAMVDWLVGAAVAVGHVFLVTQPELIERWLAAHFYAHSEQIYKQEQEGGASGTYQGLSGYGLLSTQYGQTAVDLDSSGLLAAKAAAQNATAGGGGANRKSAFFHLGRSD